MNVGEKIKKRRKELGLSADQLAEKLGKDRSTIYRYESKEIEKLPVDIIEPLAKALLVTPQFLMGWTEEKNTPQREERTPEGERHQKYEEIFNLFDSLSEERTELAFKGLLYLMNIPDDKLPEAVRYLQFLSENAES